MDTDKINILNLNNNRIEELNYSLKENKLYSIDIKTLDDLENLIKAFNLDMRKSRKSIKQLFEEIKLNDS